MLGLRLFARRDAQCAQFFRQPRRRCLFMELEQGHHHRVYRRGDEQGDSRYAENVSNCGSYEFRYKRLLRRRRFPLDTGIVLENKLEEVDTISQLLLGLLRNNKRSYIPFK